jgi:hypothetical protein
LFVGTTPDARIRNLPFSTSSNLDFVELIVGQFNQVSERGRDSSRPQVEADHVKHCDSQRTEILAILISAVLPVVVGSLALAAQDKYTVKVPNGLSFSDFRGYEDWQTVTVSQIESSNLLRSILANPVMIKAYRAGIPDNGKPFPNGSKIAKLEWTQKKITAAPWSESTPDTMVDTLKFVEFIEKDTKKFPDTHGWGYAEFAYDAASDTFKPAVTDTNCGASCHEIAGAARDYIFNSYAKR